MSPLFSRSKRQVHEQSAVPDALADLNERLSNVEKAMQSLALDWADTMDKINRWAARQAARDRHALAKLAEGAAGEESVPVERSVEELEAAAAQTRAAQKAALRARIRRGA